MKKALVTGAGGFLGWHLRCALRSLGIESITLELGSRFSLSSASELAKNCDVLFHLAGVNRGSHEEIVGGNVEFAEQVAELLSAKEIPFNRVVYANSVQSGNGSPYGGAKQLSAELLKAATQRSGSRFIDIQLPNLFGESGRPNYNMVTSSFCEAIIRGEHPRIVENKVLTMLHAQNAADLLISAGESGLSSPHEFQIEVSTLASRLADLASVYFAGEMPNLATELDRDLLNTLRSHSPLYSLPFKHTSHRDSRGQFTEILRTYGGEGQFSFSTSNPGAIRGNHFHRRKIERFTVLQGVANVSMRKLFTDHVHSFVLDGDAPTSLDMPTLWAHSLTNLGSEPLTMAFWVNEHLNPDEPDTIFEEVSRGH